jgi:hypothetical protein
MTTMKAQNKDYIVELKQKHSREYETLVYERCSYTIVVCRSFYRFESALKAFNALQTYYLK